MPEGSGLVVVSWWVGMAVVVLVMGWERSFSVALG